VSLPDTGWPALTAELCIVLLVLRGRPARHGRGTC
jgi:hypothetical protein